MPFCFNCLFKVVLFVCLFVFLDCWIFTLSVIRICKFVIAHLKRGNWWDTELIEIIITLLSTLSFFLLVVLLFLWVLLLLSVVVAGHPTRHNVVENLKEITDAWVVCCRIREQQQKLNDTVVTDCAECCSFPKPSQLNWQREWLMHALCWLVFTLALTVLPGPLSRSTVSTPAHTTWPPPLRNVQCERKLKYTCLLKSCPLT